MATTTATITISSADLLSDELALTTTATLTAADKAHKVYLKNTSTTAAEFFLLTVNAEIIGRLYAGDWALFPWSAHDNDCDIKIDPSAADMVLEHMLFVDE